MGVGVLPDVSHLRAQHPAHRAQVVALVGVTQVPGVGWQRRQRGIWPRCVLLQYDDVIAAIVGLKGPEEEKQMLNVQSEQEFEASGVENGGVKARFETFGVC